MRDIWTNNTWVDWLKSHSIPQDHYALLETNGYGIPKKVLAVRKKGEDLFNLIPTKKGWTIAHWHDFGHFQSVGSLHPGAEFIQEHYKKNKKKRK